MKYIADIDTNDRFLQIIGITETGKSMEYPFAFQTRKTVGLVRNLIDILYQAEVLIAKIETDYHEDEDSKRAFNEGTIIFQQAETPITCMIKMRQVTLLIGSTQLGSQPIVDINSLKTALRKII